MNVCVVGLGSMGKRRIRNLRAISSDIEIIGVDSNEERRQFAKNEFGIQTSGDFSEAIKNYKFNEVIVSTGPLSHSKIIETALSNNCNVFSEINLVSDGYENNIKLAEENDKVLFLSSTQMYRKEISYIKKSVQQSGNVNYTYHVGQYLPTWHTWESYKDFFVNDERTNGCREIFAIELPWIIDTFGNVRDFSVVKGNMTTLDINYPDYYIVVLTHENGTRGTLNFNVASINPVRNLEIYGQDLFLQWMGTPDSLFSHNKETNKLEQVNMHYSLSSFSNKNTTILEDAYELELIEFFNVINNTAKPRYSFNKDMELLKIIDKFEGKYDNE